MHERRESLLTGWSGSPYVGMAEHTEQVRDTIKLSCVADSLWSM